MPSFESTAHFACAFSDFYGVPFTLTTNSGTSAYFAALAALDLPRRSTIVLPALAWPQLLAPLRFFGLRPVFADTDKNGRILAESVKAVLRADTSAVVLCHLFGNPSESCEIARICNSGGLRLIEDCSQALMATDHGRRVGTFASCGIASLGRGKLLTASEGGLLWTHDPEIYRRAFSLTQHVNDGSDSTMEATILKESLSLRMHPTAAIAALRDLKTFTKRSEMVHIRHEELRMMFASAGIQTPRHGLNAAPRWSHFAALPTLSLACQADHLWSRRIPACLLSASRTPNARRFARFVRFVDSGRRWGNVVSEDIRQIFESFRLACVQ